MGCETIEDIKELDKLKKELAKDPKNVELLLRIGMILFDPFIDMDKGRAYFEKAIELEPDNPNLLFWFGYALYHNECDYKAAKKLFERALSLDPERPEFNYMMFYVLWQMNDNEKKGLKYLLKTIKLQPGWLSPIRQYVTYLIKQNEFDKTEKKIFEAYIILEKRYKNKKLPDPNLLEKYYINSSGYANYEFEKSGLDFHKEKIEKKKKLISAPSKAGS